MKNKFNTLNGRFRSDIYIKLEDLYHNEFIDIFNQEAVREFNNTSINATRTDNFINSLRSLDEQFKHEFF